MPANVLNEVFTPRTIAEYWENSQSDAIPYLGQAFFPPRKQLGIDLRWIKGRKGLPVSLMPTTWDAEPTLRPRQEFKITQTEMPFFREGIRVSETDRRDINRIRDANDPYLNAALARVYDDVGNVLEAARVVAERERMQLLFPTEGNMGISIKANGVDYTYDYDAPDPGSTTREWKSTNYFALSGTSLWTATGTADPFTDIGTAQSTVSGLTGTTPNAIILNTYTLHLLSKCDAVKNQRVYLGGVVNGYMSDAELVDILQKTLGLTVYVYDKQYMNEDREAKSYVPDGYVSLLPNRAIGETVYGVTPEESDLMNGMAGDDQVVVVDTGVAIHQELKTTPPIQLFTYASEIVLPSFEGMNEVAVLKVTA